MSQELLESAIAHWIDRIDDDLALAQIAARAVAKIAMGVPTTSVSSKWVLTLDGGFAPVSLLHRPPDVPRNDYRMARRWQRDD